MNHWLTVGSWPCGELCMEVPQPAVDAFRTDVGDGWNGVGCDIASVIDLVLLRQGLCVAQPVVGPAARVGGVVSSLVHGGERGFSGGGVTEVGVAGSALTGDFAGVEGTHPGVGIGWSAEVILEGFRGSGQTVVDGL